MFGRCSHPTFRMLAATQSESDTRTLTKAVPHAVFHSSTGDQQFLVALFNSPEVPCLTNITLPFPTIPQLIC